MTDTTHGADPINAFEQAIREAGMNPPKEIVPDGEIHRFAPNGNPKDDAGWYVLHADGEIPAGAFGDWRQDTHHKWSAKGRQEMTQAEREAYRERVAEQRRQREEERRQRQARARERAQEIWDRAKPAASDHPYLQKKGVPALKGLRQDGDRLVVKMHDGKTLHGLQFINPEGEKKFLQDTAKDGCYCGFGKPVDVIVLAEGYATAASIREATEQPVAVAFDSGNLPKVAQALHKKLPNALILIAGDNDSHGKGQAKSEEAAKAVGGQAIVPAGEGDDWNDVHLRNGLEAVRTPFDQAIYGRGPDQGDDRGDVPPPADPADYGAPVDDGPAGGPLDTFHGAPFRVLGYNRDTFYYYPYGAGQIIELPARSHKKENLIRLAPLQWWEREFPTKSGCDWSASTNALFRAADAKGIFNPSSCRRGRGIWFDKGHAVFNLGDRLIVDGEELDFRDLSTRYVYEAGEPLTAELHKPLKASEAVQLLEICQDIKWVRGISAHLLAGWIMIAPLSGALHWRPHIWITGPAHSGKSTVINDIVRRVLGALAFNFEGQSSESALRQRMEYDALPVVFDESEQNDEHSRKLIQSVINLARISSSGGFVYKGTQNQSGAKAYLARSCMCLSSVNLTLQHYQDETRFTPLSTAKIDTRDPEQKELNEAHYQELSRKIVETLTPEFSNRLFMRAIRLLPTILKNADVFGQAAASYLGNRRVGDQLGPMLAGAYALAKGREVTFDEAYQWVSEKDWSEHTPADAERNEEKLLNTIMQYPTRVQSGNGGVHDRTLGELVDAARDKDEGVPRDVAEKSLKRFGIRYQRQHLAESTVEGIYLSTSHTMLKRVLKDTPWGTNWREPLLQVEGAEKSSSAIRFGPGAVTRAVWIPVTAFDTS
mgnify:CR=1 FL=1